MRYITLPPTAYCEASAGSRREVNVRELVCGSKRARSKCDAAGRTSASEYGAVSAAPLVGGVLSTTFLAN